MNPSTDTDTATIEHGVLFLFGRIVSETVGTLERRLSKITLGGIEAVDGAGVTELDTAGALLITRLSRKELPLRNFGPRAQRLIDLTVLEAEPLPPSPPRVKMTLERFGGLSLKWMEHVTEIAVLIVDIIYWSIVGIFNRKQYRKGSFVEQAFYIGSTAVPIVGTILFLIGLILTLQGAGQLSQFGATIYVVNMLALGLAREFAPLMTAIIVSGRSGSAIASEIATMKFTEELDAIKTLGLNPIRFVVVPKFWAMVTTLPLLSIFALFIGIVGGYLIAITYMNLSTAAFMNQLYVSLFFWDVVTGLIKAVSFAVIITIVGVYRGLTFTGGADGVGRATTASVVTSIFVIIVMDSIWGIVFYFR